MIRKMLAYVKQVPLLVFDAFADALTLPYIKSVWYGQFQTPRKQLNIPLFLPFFRQAFLHLQIGCLAWPQPAV